MVTVMQMSTAGDASNSQMHITPAEALRQARSMHSGLNGGSQAVGSSTGVSPAVEPVVVEALYPYAGDDQNHLHFAKGDLVEVWGRESSGWWDGILIKSRSHERGARGWFPSNYVKPLTAEQAASLLPETHRAPSILHRLVASQTLDSQPRDAGTANAPEGYARTERRTPELLDDTSLDILLGRRGADNGTSDLDQLLRWSPSSGTGGQQTSGEDLTSFSSGGDIFGEIAAAAAADHRRSPSRSNDRVDLPGAEELARSPPRVAASNTQDNAQSNLLPPHDIVEGSSITPTLPSGVSSARQSNVMDPDWVPKISADGRIYYYNNRTGTSAYDLPSPSTSSSASHLMRSESGTAASDKSKWTSGGTSVSEQHHYTHKSTNSDSLARKDSYSEDVASVSTQRLSTDSSAASSSPFRSVSRSSGHREPTRAGAFSSPGRSVKSKPLDASGTPRKASIATQSSIAPVASKRRSAVVSRKLEATLKIVKPIAPPLLVQLERQCVNALTRLSSAVQHRSEVYDRKASTDTKSFQDEECSCRDELVEASIDINNATRQLLSVTDVILEQPQHSTHASDRMQSADRRTSQNTSSESVRDSHAGIQSLPLLPIAEFRPLAMKITATESKLMLSIRTTWGLLATSPSEEASVNSVQKMDNYSEEEMVSLHRQQNIQLASRRDIDTKLRFDLLVQIRTLGDAIATFVEQIEVFAEKHGCTVTKTGLQLAIPAQAEPSLSPEDVLLPAASTAGNMRGHGFEHYYPASTVRQRQRDPQTDHDRKAKLSMRPRHVLSAALVQDLESDRKALLGDFSALEAIMRTVLSCQKRAYIIPTSLIPTVSTQVMGFLNRLGRLLKQLEDVDIAARLDIDFDAVSSDANPPSEQISAEEATYIHSLRQASSVLRDFVRIKGLLYAIPSRAFLCLQNSTMLHLCYPLSLGSIPPAQPKDGSPLSTCVSLRFLQAINTHSIMDILADVGQLSQDLLSSLEKLNGIAEDQSRIPSSFRQLNAEARLKEAARAQAIVSRRSSQDEDAAEELETNFGTGSSINSTIHSPGKRFSNDNSGSISEQLARAPSSQSFVNHRENASRTSRSNSLANSLSSDTSKYSGYSKGALDDPRAALLDVDLRDSPSSHSPSKSKLKQFFGDDAPGQIVRRPTQASREVPSYLQQDYNHNEITFSTDNSVKAGTLHALVCRLTNHQLAESQYNNAFLMTYRTFTDAHELLERLKGRYYLQAPQGLNKDEYRVWIEQKQKLVRVRVINVIRSWLIDHLYEEDENGLLDRISAFAVTLPNESSQQIARIIERRRATGAPRRMTASISGGVMPPPIVPRNMKKIKFLDVDPLEIARQFTIMDSRLFAKITVDECLAKAWPKKFGDKPTPNFTAIADLSNAVTIWVAMSIASQTDVRKRVNIIKHFIAIADKCRQLSNFTTLMHIVAGLGSSAIYRLKRTWELVNQRPMATFTFLGNLMSPENNHALYRDALRLVGSPCVPFLGVYFTDWVMSGEANSDMLRDKPDQINFAKRAKVADSIAQIQLHQATPYNLTPVPQLQTWLQGELDKSVKMAQDPLSKDLMSKAYAMSLVIEPREREDERIARLLSESGFL